jgi:fumarylacetoacetate (FAA) hydrolase family protein
VSISSPDLGTLVNTVTPSESAPVWDFGIRDLIRALRTAS